MSTNKHALSDDWRTGPSLNQPIDMANALRSIQKVIAAIDTRNCEVSFNSYEESHFSVKNDELNIRIDPKFALKSTPIQGNDFDILVGLSIHEALHSACLSDRIKSIGPDAYANVSRIGEEIYIDNFGKRNFPVLGKYIHLAREGYKLGSDQISWDNVFTVWTAIAVYGIMPEGGWLSETRKIAQLQLLMELSSILIGKDHSPAERQGLYEETSKRLAKMLEREQIEDKLRQGKEKEPEISLDAPHGLVEIKSSEGPERENDNAEIDDAQGTGKENETDSEEGEEEKRSGDEEGNDEDGENDASVQSVEDDEGKADKTLPRPGKNVSDANEADASDEKEESDLGDPPVIIELSELLHPTTTQLSSEVANAINEVLESGIEDMTAEVSSTFGVSGNTTIIWNKAKTDIDTEFNQALAKQLVWVKDYKNTQGHQVYRNEERGRLDSQRIFKAPINGLIFKRRVELPKSNLDLVMLLDASGSMSHNTSIYDDAKALHQTLPESVILSYSDHQGIMLTEHTEGRIFREVLPDGGTPTAKALAATALRFPNSLIIHFTDGECNRKELAELIPKIHTQFPKIKMVHVQLQENRHYRNRYQDSSDVGIPEVPGVSKTIMMDSVMDFPNKLKDILKEW